MTWFFRKLHVIAVRVSNRSYGIVGNFTSDVEPGQPLRDWLEMRLAASLAQGNNEGFGAFDDWNKVSLFQEGRTVGVDEDCATLRLDTPLLCVLNMDDSMPASLAAGLILEKWIDHKKNEEADQLANRLAQRLGKYSGGASPVVPTSQERHWLSSTAVVGLKRFFHHASDEIASKLRANPTRREDGLTDELVYEVFSNTRSRDLLRDLLAPSGLVLELSCEESGSAERVLGSDLGFCLTVRGPGLLTQRAILLQAKRLHPTPDEFTPGSSYGDLLQSDGREQARKMLDISPCSYFLLYNPLGLNAILSHRDSAIEIRSSLDYSTDGISVLPASIVEGMDRATWEAVGHLHSFTCSFVKFLVDDFIQGKVGDRSRRALRAALTRKLRRDLDLGGDDETPPPRFTITMTLDVTGMSGFGGHPNPEL